MIPSIPSPYIKETLDILILKCKPATTVLCTVLVSSILKSYLIYYIVAESLKIFYIVTAEGSENITH